LWIVTGEEKKDSLKHLLSRDPSIPAARVGSDRAIVLADRDASN
jgi:6-phosphogluconolactonase/glucosamine-6-phosphate isomerase/deaminase